MTRSSFCSWSRAVSEAASANETLDSTHRGSALEERDEQGRFRGRQKIRIDSAENRNRSDASDDVLPGGEWRVSILQ